MRKYLLIGLLLCIVGMPLCVGAELGPTGEKSNAKADWFVNNPMEKRVAKLLQGNIAFVDGCSTVWLYDKKVDMGAPAVMAEDKSFTIPAAFANTLGVSALGESVSAAAVADKLSMHTFVDDRGFLLLSNKKDAVNQTIVGEGAASYYYDFYNVVGAIGTITWDDVNPAPEDYERYLKQWREELTYPEGMEEKYDTYIKSAVKAGKSFLPMVSWDEEALSPFTDQNIEQSYSTQQYLDLEAVYSRIYTMAKGSYLCGHSDTQLKDAVLYALKLMHNRYYAPGWEESGSVRWTTYQFTLPFQLGNSLCLMKDVMPQEELKSYVDAVFDKNPDPTMSLWNNKTYNAHYYTNRMWIGTSYFNCAMLVQDAERANYVMRYLNQTFDYVDRNAGVDMAPDGFYKDGSMVFHNSQAYNMGYGASYTSVLADFLDSSKNTCFDVRKVYGYDHIYSFIKDSFLPFIVHNQRMKMVMGRERENGAIGIMAACMRILNEAPEEVRAALTPAMKATIGKYTDEYAAVNTSGRFSGYPINREAVECYLDYMEKLPATEFKSYNKVYYNMDRVVHERENFRLGIAMSSSRIEKYEGFNSGLGLDEWYIGDGMTYIYTDSRDQYTKNWLATVNHYYMPGTTVDSTPRSTEVETRNNPNWGLPENDYAGGVSDGQDGAAGMILGNQYVSGLQGRKSWFMFGDQVVCLGSGITGGKGEVYTTVDNRLLKEKNTQKLEEDVSTLEIKSMRDYENKSQEELWLIADGDDSTNWRNQTIGSWIEFDFGEEVELGGPAIQFSSGSSRQAIMRFEASSDGETYTEVFNGRSSGTTDSFEYFPVQTRCRYFRIVNLGNTVSDWMTVPEVRFFPGNLDTKTVMEVIERPNIGYETVLVDGEKLPARFDVEMEKQDVSWTWEQNAGGYVFMDHPNVVLRREFSSIGAPYMISYLKHGTAPDNQSYAYTLLPNATAEETQSWAEEPAIEVLENSTAMHAVRERESGKVAASVFDGGSVAGITFFGAASVLIEQEFDTYTMYLSDPTQKQNSITMVFDRPIVLKGKGAKVDKDGKTVTVDVSLRKGDTYSFSWRYQDENTDSGITASDYRLRMTAPLVVTSLYASDAEGGTLSYQIYREPQYGTAQITGNRFVYTLQNYKNVQDQVTVKAETPDGRFTLFDIEIRGGAAQ